MGAKSGLRLTFEDHGPGIADIEQALKDGFTTGSGMGLGLGGSKRLVNEFSIESEVGKGTKITVVAMEIAFTEWVSGQRCQFRGRSPAHGAAQRLSGWDSTRLGPASSRCWPRKLRAMF